MVAACGDLDAINRGGAITWEALWAPYDGPTYRDVLSRLQSNDVVLEIGAGDLRLARQIAQVAKKVFAIENQRPILEHGLSGLEGLLPKNLEIIEGDACLLPFPADVTVGVLLMRHCTHFQLYASKLRAILCQRMITNARWHLGIETIYLQNRRIPFKDLAIGWYSCWCGATGFISGPPDELTPEVEAILYEVIDCPQCPDSK